MADLPPNLSIGRNYFGYSPWDSSGNRITVWIVYNSSNEDKIYFHYLVWGLGRGVDFISRRAMESNHLLDHLKRELGEAFREIRWEETR